MISQSAATADVDIWFWASARWPTAAVPRAELNGDELALAATLGRRQSEFIVNRALLRRVLSRQGAAAPATWVFSRNHCGKPLAQAADGTPDGTPAPYFNLSHAGELTICAVSAQAVVGVDIEPHDNGTALLAVADQYFSERELADLKALPEETQAAAFFDYWTLKEAYLKARGEGLVQPLDSFSFFPGNRADIGFECAPEHVASGAQGPRPWHFALLCPAAGYTAALAVQHETPRLRYWVACADGRIEEASPATLMELLRDEIG